MPQRIAAVEPPYTDEVAEALQKMMPGGQGEPLRLFRTLARSVSVGKRTTALGGALIASPNLQARDREIVLLRTTARCNAEYEWGVHAAVMAPSVGLDEAQLLATLGDSTDGVWSPRDALLIRLADELHDEASISDELWTELSEVWDESALLDLIVTAGFYHVISFVVNAGQVQHEDWATRFSDVRKG